MGCAALRRAGSGYPRSFGQTTAVSIPARPRIPSSSPFWALGSRGCWLSQGRVAERHDAANDLGGRCIGGPSSFPPQVPTTGLRLYDFTTLYRLSHQLCYYSTATNMSRASQVTLATTCFTAISIVAFVHWSQKADKAVSTLNMQAACTFADGAFRQCTWVLSATTNNNG